MGNSFSEPVTIFHGLTLPEEGTPAGYAAIIDAYNLPVPLPYKLCAIGNKHRVFESAGWRFFTPRHAPQPDLEGHLVFALKNEGIDLAVLSRLFNRIGPKTIEEMIKKTPTGAYARRIWFLYEWMTGMRLEVPDLETGTYVPVLDPDMQYGVSGERKTRQRVIDNLPGTAEFCPLVFRTPLLDSYIGMDLKTRAREVIGSVPADLVARAASFLLLKDSRSSFNIEGETPPHNRVERWGRIIGQAGRKELTGDELVRLQQIVIGDNRFVTTGFRQKGGFIGEHDRTTGTPIPEHISARPEDLESLIQGLLKYDRRTSGKLDPVIAAASLSFGFVYIHPFSDGNGRLHRYLFHHVLAREGYNPPGMIFPVSAAILERIDDYREVLRGYSAKLLPFIEWEPTRDNNVQVLCSTDDYYRFFDSTPHAAFLFSCVEGTVQKDLPMETAFLRMYDRFKAGVEEIVEMPSDTVNLLFRFLRQNNGKLSNRAREKEFQKLEENEVDRIEEVYGEVFGENDF